MRTRSRKPRNRGDLADPAYLSWLRTRPCRVPGCPNTSSPHHLRHDENGAALGAHIKDDRRAISLCHADHMRLHNEPWSLRRVLAVDDLRQWQDDQLAAQRAEYVRRAA